MSETDRGPTDFVRPGSRRTNATSHLSVQLSSTTSVPLHSPRPGSSIYSRSVAASGYQDHRNTVTMGAENNTRSWLHPAMRRATASMSSVTSFSNILRGLPFEEQLKPPHNKGNTVGIDSKTSTGSSADDSCRGLYPRSNSDAEQQGPATLGAAASKRKRQFRVSSITIGGVGVAVMVMVIIVILVVSGKLGDDGEAEASQPVIATTESLLMEQSLPSSSTLTPRETAMSETAYPTTITTTTEDDEPSTTYMSEPPTTITPAPSGYYVTRIIHDAIAVAPTGSGTELRYYTFTKTGEGRTRIITLTYDPIAKTWVKNDSWNTPTPLLPPAAVHTGMVTGKRSVEELVPGPGPRVDYASEGRDG